MNSIEQMMTLPSLADRESRIVQDYDKARVRSMWNRVIRRILGRQNDLEQLDLSEKEACEIPVQREGGIQIVDIAEIRGSLGRSKDFDRSFMPRNDNTKDRWMNVDRAYYKGLTLEPVELYQKEDGHYYVMDGHHRISVALWHGQRYIEARVISGRMDDQFCDIESVVAA